MTEALIAGAVTLLVCMVNNYFQQRAVKTQNDKTTALIVYRLEQLENKVQTHNNLIERMYKAEDQINIHEEKIKMANHRIDDLEKGEK